MYIVLSGILLAIILTGTAALSAVANKATPAQAASETSLHTQDVTAAPPTSDAVIHGIVRDSKDGSPMRNAFVSFAIKINGTIYQYQDNTDDQGKYVISRSAPSNEGMQSGSYTLYVRGDVSAVNALNYIPLAKDGVLIDSTKSQELNIDMINLSSDKPMKDAIFFGIVKDPNGAPLPHSFVSMYLKNGQRVDSWTNQNGFYQVVPGFSSTLQFKPEDVDFFYVIMVPDSTDRIYGPIIVKASGTLPQEQNFTISQSK